MALKSKKGNREGARRPWPDLPKQLLTAIGKQSSLMSVIAYGSCHSARKSLWLELSDKSHPDGCQGNSSRNIFGISFQFGGYLVGTRTVCLSLGIAHPTTLSGIPQNVPFPFHGDPRVPFKYVALSRSPYEPNWVVMVLTGINKLAFAFYRRGDNKMGEYAWIKQDCTLVDPGSASQKPIQFTNAIGFKGKFFALSLQGTLALSSSRAVPTSNGEILLVFLISRRSTSVVDCVEVHKLEFSRLSGEKMETPDGWWLYDVDTGIISPGWTSGDYPTKSLMWDEPEE
ncbi:hypothetical protein NMG60_11019045 [Bertholletia excelsa]